jgi:ubiquinone/menaquinone biosynthesis C-methylase UbiE
MDKETELSRIKAAYEKRKRGISPGLYSLLDPAHFFLVQTREMELLKELKRRGISSLEKSKILDIGCGTGNELRNFIKYGAEPENCSGIDLLEERIASARRLSPNINFKSGDATKLPWNDGLFNIVIQYTVFTSILDQSMKQCIAREMLRVLKQDGIIIWYDYHINNPSNPDVRGVTADEIKSLFPGCSIHLKRITLAPPLTRMLAPFSLAACQFLEKIRFFNTHYLGIIRRS